MLYASEPLVASAPEPMMVVTLRERKAQKLERLRAGAQEVVAYLGAYALAHGIRFVVFGSVARGDIRVNSDFDMLIDCDPPLEKAALDYAEGLCRAYGFVPDVHMLADIPAEARYRLLRDSFFVP